MSSARALFTVDAVDSDGTVERVELLANGILVGTAVLRNRLRGRCLQTTHQDWLINDRQLGL